MMGLAHTLVVEGGRRGVLARYCVGFDRFRPYLVGESDGRPRTPIGQVRMRAWLPTSSCPCAQDGVVRTMISSSWSIQLRDHGEQPLLDAGHARRHAWPDRPARRWLRLGYGAVNNIGKWIRGFPLPTLPTGSNPTGRIVPVARVTDMLLSPGAPFDSTVRSSLPRHQVGLLGAAQTPSISSKTSIACWCLARPKRSSCRNHGGRRRRVAPISCCRLPRPGAQRHRGDPTIACGSPCSRYSNPGRRRARTSTSMPTWPATGRRRGLHRRRDEMGWLSHMYADSAAGLAKGASSCRSSMLLGDRTARPAGAERAPVLMEAFRRIRRRGAQDAVRPH